MSIFIQNETANRNADRAAQANTREHINYRIYEDVATTVRRPQFAPNLDRLQPQRQIAATEIGEGGTF